MSPILSLAVLVGSLAVASADYSSADTVPAKADGAQAAQAGTSAPAPQAGAGGASGQEGDSSAAAAPSTSAGGKSFDVKNTFRNVCSFCHADYGRKASKGPQLMNSERSDEFLFDRIKHGLAGRMPGFGETFTDDQIQQIVKFIRALKPGEVPGDPA
jgi:mono/diheme cytochrome c family protein